MSWLLEILMKIFTFVTGRVYLKKQKKFASWLEDTLADNDPFIHEREDTLIQWNIQQRILKYMAGYDPVYLMYGVTAEVILDTLAKKHGYTKIMKPIQITITEPHYYQKKESKEKDTATPAKNVVKFKKN